MSPPGPGSVLVVDAASYLASALMVALVRKRGARARPAAVGQLVLGAALLAILQSRDRLVVVALSAPAGVGLAAGVGFGTALQTGVPDHLRGRVLGAFGATSALAIVSGNALASFLGGALGLLALLHLSAALHLAAGLLGLLLLPRAARAPEPAGTGSSAATRIWQVWSARPPNGPAACWG